MMLVLESFRPSGDQLIQRQLHQAKRELATALARAEDMRLQVAIAVATADAAQARIDRIESTLE